MYIVLLLLLYSFLADNDSQVRLAVANHVLGRAYSDAVTRAQVPVESGLGGIKVPIVARAFRASVVMASVRFLRILSSDLPVLYSYISG